MSPILIRPVREQLEHDRLIRFLQNKLKKKTSDVTANAGEERIIALKIGQNTYFPDLIITEGRKLVALAEVETGESVNNLEALAQWVNFSRVRAPFSLYVPVPAYDSARRLCEANQVAVTELWTYRPVMDGFDLMRMIHNPSAANSGQKAAFKVEKLPPPEVKPKEVPKEEPPEAVEPRGANDRARTAKPVAKGAGREAPGKPLPGKAPGKPAVGAVAGKPSGKPGAQPKPGAKPVAPAPQAAKSAASETTAKSALAGSKGVGAVKDARPLRDPRPAAAPVKPAKPPAPPASLKANGAKPGLKNAGAKAAPAKAGKPPAAKTAAKARPMAKAKAGAKPTGTKKKR